MLERECVLRAFGGMRRGAKNMQNTIAALRSSLYITSPNTHCNYNMHLIKLVSLRLVLAARACSSLGTCSELFLHRQFAWPAKQKRFGEDKRPLPMPLLCECDQIQKKIKQYTIYKFKKACAHRGLL